MPDRDPGRARTLATRRLPRTVVDSATGDRWRSLAALVAMVAGVAVFVVATDLFPYHSVNDDEAVYLLQAAMLLEGKLFLRPPAELADLVRPWFFVVQDAGEGVRLFSKYAPVTAATFALGLAVGVPRLSLALVAAAIVVLTYALGRELADGPTGVVAGLLVSSAPLFVFTSSTFLPYAPTTVWNLLFAYAYVRARRLDSTRYALLAGVAIGVAFFARPYTAVLFAAPFVGHTCWRLWRGWRQSDGGESDVGESGVGEYEDNRESGAAEQRGGFRRERRRALATALPGLALVGVTLAYNAVMTGSATQFPYEAFAPEDGLGFGHREILGYSETYTPELGVESTVEALGLFVGQWGPLGPVWPVLALAGIAVVGRSLLGGPSGTAGRVEHGSGRAFDRQLACLLLAVVPSVVLGNVYFWGTLNGLRNGLIRLLGPFYHFDLLVPVAVFSAVGAVALWRRTRAVVSGQFSRLGATLVLVLLLVLTAPIVAAAGTNALAEPYSENRERTEALAGAYAPFDGTEFDDALVFTPDPYGDWQQHPFQHLRNDPGFDGRALYVLDEGPAADWRALDATTRTPYRFTYRGEWGPPNEVTGHLQRLAVHRGERIGTTTTLGVPQGATSASVRLETTEATARYEVPSLDERLRVEWVVTDEGARVASLPLAFGPDVVPVPGDATEVDLVVTFVDRSGASVTYRQELTVDPSGTRVRAVGPPETRVCRLRTECGHEGTWIGDRGDYLAGVDVETTVRVVTD